MQTISNMNTKKTEQKLKLALARMLPDKLTICFDATTTLSFAWVVRENHNVQNLSIVRDTEWLHICWLVEQTFDEEQFCDFHTYLWDQADNYEQRCRGSVSASWQLRAQAICKVKGIVV